MFLFLVFTVGFSLLTSALNVRFRDVSFFVQAALIIWFYLTPIVYSVSFIPENVIWVWKLNPLTSIIQLFQNVFTSAPAPETEMLLANVLTITIVSVFGILIFRKER